MDAKSIGSRNCFATDGRQLVEQTGGGAQCLLNPVTSHDGPCSFVCEQRLALFGVEIDQCENVRCSTDGMFIAFSCSFRGDVFYEQEVAH